MKESKVKVYERFLGDVSILKDDFLFQVRQENRNTPDERVAIFVDIQNIYYGARDNFGGKIDFRKLIENILRGRKLIAAKAYLINSEVDNKGFVKLLNQFKYDVVSKNLKTRSDGSQKGNLDIEITIDVMEFKDAVDTVALVSGDGDFVPLIEYLKSKNISVEIYSIAESTAMDLRNCASRYFELDQSYLYTGN